MSAPYIIPFNHQPVNAGRSTGTYTVPAGKYARVNLDGCVLPSLNGNLIGGTIVQSYPTAMWGTGNTWYFSFNHICDQVTWSATLNSGSNYVATFVNSGPIGVSNYEYLNPTSFTKTGRMNGFNLAYNHSSNGMLSVSLTFTLATHGYIWLKAGDALSFNSGALSFEEYNVIS